MAVPLTITMHTSRLAGIAVGDRAPREPQHLEPDIGQPAVAGVTRRNVPSAAAAGGGTDQPVAQWASHTRVDVGRRVASYCSRAARTASSSETSATGHVPPALVARARPRSGRSRCAITIGPLGAARVAARRADRRSSAARMTRAPGSRRWRRGRPAARRPAARAVPAASSTAASRCGEPVARAEAARAERRDSAPIDAKPWLSTSTIRSGCAPAPRSRSRRAASGTSRRRPARTPRARARPA